MANEKEVNVNKIYGNLSKTTKEEFISNFNVNENGLTDEEVTERHQKFGYNEVTQNKPKKWYHYLFKSIFTPFNSILIGIALVLCYTDVYLAENPNYANILVICVLVTVSTLLDFISEYRSNKSAEKLKQLVATTATVIRNGKKIKVPFKDLVVGDTVFLSAGDMIPADLRIIESKDLYVGQSSLTGESDAVKKVENTELPKNEEIDSISDIDTICFMGTNVISGSAKGVVVLTSDDTYFGKIAHTLTTGKPKTSFQKGIESISKLLIKFMLILIPVVFIFTVQKHSIITSFTFAVAIAICITPLLLPVILSTSLSKGALKMSKKKTIVKKLVTYPESVSVKEFESDEENTILIEIMVPSSEMSKVIGKDGNIINSIRTIVQASSYLKDNKKIRLSPKPYP